MKNMKNRKRITKICLLVFIPVLLFYGCGGNLQGEVSSSGSTSSDSQSNDSNSFDSTTIPEDTAAIRDTTVDGKSSTSSSTDSSTSRKETSVTEKTTQSPSLSTEKSPETTTRFANSVSMVIQCKEAVEYMKVNPEKTKAYKSIVPNDGIMLNQSDIQFQQGDTVLDILERVTKEKKIILKENGGFVSNIGGLVVKAKAFGEQSGWLYSVNGEFPKIGVAVYQVKDGDKIELMFVTKQTYF